MSPPPSERNGERAVGAPIGDPDERLAQAKKFPDFVPPTKIQYGGGGPTLHLRRCRIAFEDEGRSVDRSFDQGTIRIGAMDDNDLIVRDDTVSRYHCKIVQEDTGYVLYDLGSTNGTFINKVRVREAYLKSGSTVHLGETQLTFFAGEEEVEIVPSRKEQMGELVGKSPKMREIYAILEKIAPTNTTVVVEGETGTGKEVVAQQIHKMSLRANGPLMVFDCGAVPENLIESELFGHEKGSFTGAIMTRQGLFEMGDGGTVFLDELGELPLDLQPKLLRALEQREIRRVGSNRSLKVDVRIIAATNRNLEDEVRAGRFRQDLFYRLSVVRLILPPLRERPDDIALLARHFLRNHVWKLPDGTTKVRSFSREAMEVLSAYRWPGNVRELVNSIERAVSFADGEVVETRDLPEHIRDAVMTGPGGTIPPPLRPAAPGPARSLGGGSPAFASVPEPRPAPESFDVTFKEAKERWVSSFERDYIVALLKKNGGNISHAAREADIDRKYFRKLMKKYAIEAAGAPDEDDDELES